MMKMPELTAMMNIGKKMARKLPSVGADFPEKLIELGAKQTFTKLKEAYPNVCLVHFYTLEGAIYRLSRSKKKELKELGDSLKKM